MSSSGGGSDGTTDGVEIESGGVGVRRLVPTSIRRSYAAKIVVVLVSVGLLLGAGGVGMASVLSEDAVDNTQNNYETVVKVEGDAFQSQISQLRRDAKSISSGSVVRNGTAEERRQYFREERVNMELGTIHSIDLIDDSSRKIIASTDSSRIGTVTTEEQTGIKSTQTSQYIPSALAGPHKDPADGTVVFTAISTVGDTGTTVLINVDVRLAKQQFKGKELTENSFITVVSQDGTVLFYETNQSRVLQSYGSGNESLPFRAENERHTTNNSTQSNAASLPKNGAIEAGPVDGIIDTKHVAAYSRIDANGMGWYVILHTPVDEAYGFANDLQRNMLLASGINVLIIGLVGVVLGQRTSQSIRTLSTKAKAMESGDLSVDLSTGRIDSIGALYSGFDSMRDTLQAQIREAESARKEAETEREAAEEARETAEREREAAERERERVQELNEDLEKTAQEYCDVMGKAADGDLSVRTSVNASDETMQEIGEEFNAMLAQMERRFTASTSSQRKSPLPASK